MDMENKTYSAEIYPSTCWVKVLIKDENNSDIHYKAFGSIWRNAPTKKSYKKANAWALNQLNTIKATTRHNIDTSNLIT